MKRFFQMIRLTRLHHVFAIALAIVYVVVDQKRLFVINVSNDLLSNSITILAIVIGFIGTIQTLILTLQNTKLIRNLKEQEYTRGHSYYSLYITQLNSTIFWGFLSILLSLCVLALNGQYTSEELRSTVGEWNLRKGMIAFWVYSLTADAVSFYQSIAGMNSILNSRGNKE